MSIWVARLVSMARSVSGPCTRFKIC